jgi:hypothetical protein
MLTGEPIFGMQSAESIADASIAARNFIMVDGGITAYDPSDPVFVSYPVDPVSGFLSFQPVGDSPPAELYCESVRSSPLM